MFESLKNKTVLITGGSRGIGYSIVKMSIKYGLNVALTYYENELDLSELKKNIIDKQVRIEQYKLDLADRGNIRDIVHTIEDDFGNIHYLVNNAGVKKDGFLLLTSEDSWDEVHTIDLKGTFLLCKEVLPIMMQNDSGAIVNMSSIAGLTGVIGQTNYCAAKSGLIGFTKALAKEVAYKNIRVNSVAPGYVDTDMTQSIPKKMLENIGNNILLKRMAKPDEIASTVLFLLSNGASYITGTNIVVDGGVLS